jgi:deoxycytidylate deaminase
MSEKWDRRFLDLAAHVAQWSKDASTKVGAVITDSRKRIVSIGFNGYPANVDDSKVPSREEKLQRLPWCRILRWPHCCLLWERGEIKFNGEFYL